MVLQYPVKERALRLAPRFAIVEHSDALHDALLAMLGKVKNEPEAFNKQSA